MKKILIGTMLAALLLTTASCAKKVECDFCGEMKHCEERILFDDEEAKVFICEDCISELEEEFDED